MTKTLLASAALALIMGMSGSAFAAPGSQNPPGQGGPNGVDGCVAGQAGVVVLGLRDQAKDAGQTPGELVNFLISIQPTPGADDFVQGSLAWCEQGRGDDPS